MSSACYQYTYQSVSQPASRTASNSEWERTEGLYNQTTIITRRMTNRWAGIGMPRITNTPNHSALYPQGQRGITFQFGWRIVCCA